MLRLQPALPTFAQDANAWQMDADAKVRMDLMKEANTIHEIAM